MAVLLHIDIYRSEIFGIAQTRLLNLLLVKKSDRRVLVFDSGVYHSGRLDVT